MLIKRFQFSMLAMLLVFLCSLWVAATVEPAYAAGQAKYTVVPGDNLYDIGIEHGVSADALMKANGLGSTIIHPGQVLIIPGKAASVKQVSRGSARYTQAELNLLARLINAEAASESYLAKVAVGAVVLNRVKSSEFPNSIAAVINQSQNGTYQFTPVYNGSINRPAGPDSLRAAREALSGVDPTGGALFFFESRVTDGHLRSRTVSKVIGKLVFSL